MTESVLEYDVDDFLEHFGVKGMKWGRRKSREERNTAYRDKLSNYAGDVVRDVKEARVRNKASVDDLKKNGGDAKAYKDLKEYKARTIALDLMAKGYSARDAQINGFIMSLNYDKTQMFSDLAASDGRLKQRGETFTARQKAIMGLSMAEVSKRDIRKAYRNA